MKGGGGLFEYGNLKSVFDKTSIESDIKERLTVINNQCKNILS